MSLSDELYKEVILDHYQNPRNFGHIDHAQIHESGINPLCGDELELFINLDGGRISEVRFNGKGCSISQASASMMTEAILGKTVNEAESIIGKFKSMIIDDKDPMFGEELEDIASLEGVKKFPVRVKCALLSWNTLEKALKS